MRVPDHPTYRLRNLFAGQKVTARTLYGTTDWLRIENGVRQGSPAYLTYILNTSREICQVEWLTSWNQNSWEKHQHPPIYGWYHSSGRKRRETKEPLDEGEGGAGLRLNIKNNNNNKSKIMASGPITLWQIEGGNGEVVIDFLFLGSKFTSDADCSHEIRRWLLLGRKTMTNLDSVLKIRSITLLTEVYIVFPVVMYSCESLTVKKAEWRRIDAFKLWYWRLLKIPWTARRSNQSVLREINPEHSLEGLIRKLKFEYFGHLIQTADSLEKSLMLGKIEGRRRRGPQRMRWLDGVTNAMDVNCKLWEMAKFGRCWGIGKPGMLQSKGSQRVRHDWVTEQ